MPNPAQEGRPLSSPQVLSLQSVPSEQSVAPLPEYLEQWQASLGWQPSPEQQSQFQQLYRAIVLGNQQLNLTRLTEPDEFWEKHLWDSLRGLKPWLMADADASTTSVEAVGPTPMTAIDIGTGGGFPGVPAAIALSQLTVTLLDSTRKKVNFLEQLIQLLSLERIHTLTQRAEVAGRDRNQRDRYDLAFIRAVGPATVCAEYSLPLLKLGGTAILYRGQWTDTETQDLEAALNHLGGEITQVDAFTTPLTQSTRHCIYLRKTAPTPAEFPRPVGIPSQKPLPQN